ncbi:MAG TPA: hypothetical protein VGX69_08050 [Solirubrobacteraceae bacterium]|nr:hypothetical protein [Solirubrobacteraceae bacterium]
MPYRPLAILSGLTIGDYLLWNWSLNGSHDVLSLVSGLTLPPLAIACLWLLALTIGRLLGHLGRGASPGRTRKPAAKRRRSAAPPQPAPQSAARPASASSSARASRKLAA